MSVDGWYYRKEGAFEDKHIGPMSEDQVAALIAKKKLKNQSLLLHPTLTGNQWRTLATLDFSAAIARHEAEVARHEAEVARHEAEIARQRKQKEAAAREREALERKNREEVLLQMRAEAEAAQREKAAQEQREKANMAAERKRYLNAVADLRKKYRVMLADSTAEAERVCNAMGWEGWELEQSFSDTFTYSQCCGTESKRQIVLVFSQPLEINST